MPPADVFDETVEVPVLALDWAAYDAFVASMRLGDETLNQLVQRHLSDVEELAAHTANEIMNVKNDTDDFDAFFREYGFQAVTTQDETWLEPIFGPRERVQ